MRSQMTSPSAVEVGDMVRISDAPSSFWPERNFPAELKNELLEVVQVHSQVTENDSLLVKLPEGVGNPFVVNDRQIWGWWFYSSALQN